MRVGREDDAGAGIRPHERSPRDPPCPDLKYRIADLALCPARDDAISVGEASEKEIGVTMSRQITVDAPQVGLLVARFRNPPINLIDMDTINELHELVTALERSSEIRAVVFRSEDPDFFMAHWDVLADKQKVAAMPPGPTGMHPWIDVLARLSRAPVASIAEIRGRARGAGSEFVLACDMRFASIERGILGQFEVGLGAVPGGNPMARLAGLMGRGRALEVILGADDFDAVRAERYGYINRAVPDDEIEAVVDALARRIASFEKHAVAGAKALMDDVSLPADAVFPPALSAFFKSVAQPGTRARAVSLLEQGLQRRGTTELDLGRAVGAFRPKGA